MDAILDKDIIQIRPKDEDVPQTLWLPGPVDIKSDEEVVLPDTLDDEAFNRLFVENVGLDSNIWRWRPAAIHDWLLGKRYLNLSGVLRKAVYEDICNFFESTDGNPWNRKYDEAWFEEGIGSGKSFKTSCIATYFEHLLLCLWEPQYYFHLDKSSKIAIMNMSISERNAVKIIFSEIKQKIDGCVWFNERPWERDDARMPDPNCLSELRFKNNTFIMSGSSSWRTAVGYHILVGIIDEAGSYRKTDNSDQAGDIYHTLQRRLGSRFEQKGAIIGAGSPMYENDFLESKMKEGQDPLSRIYSKRRTLWEAKYPDWDADFFYVDRVQRLVFDDKPQDTKDIDIIPKIPFLYKAFKANVTKAYRDFGATPSATINAFFENPKVLWERINRNRTEDPVDNLGGFKSWFKPIDKSAFHAIHIDLATSGDACGFCLGHNAGVTDEGGIIVYIDLMMRIKGTPENPIRISKIREYIYALKSLGFNIRLITYDGFQCLRKGTKIKCLDGIDRKIQDFKGGEYVYSMGEDNRITFGKVKRAWLTGNKELLRIWLDNDKYVDCSENHPFMMRDGKYKNAEELIVVDSLMPLYTRISERQRDGFEGYEMLYQPLKERGLLWEFTHRTVSRGMKIIKRGHLIHHNNGNKLDNNPNNLKCLTFIEHGIIHKENGRRGFEIARERLKNNPEAQKRRDEALIKTNKRTWKLFPDKMKESLSKGNKLRWSNPNSHLDMSKFIANRNRGNKYRLGKGLSEVTKNRISDKIKDLWDNPEYKKKQIEAHKGNKGYWTGKKRSLETIEKIRASKLNHKIIKIERLGIDEVWDIEIEGHHNFALSTGVFVHNSTDSMQILQAKGYSVDLLSVDRTTLPYSNLKEAINENRIDYYCVSSGNIEEPSASEVFITEASKLEEIEGKKIDHPPKGSKDVADAMAGVVHNVVENAEYFGQVQVAIL